MHGYNPKKLTHPSFIRIKKTDFSRLRLQKYFFLFNYTKTNHENSTPALQQNYTHQPKNTVVTLPLNIGFQANNMLECNS